MDLPGLVEIRRLPRNKPFFLAASSAIIPALETWLESGQVKLDRVRIVGGFPDGWTLFRSSGAIADDAVRAAVPELTLPAAISMRLYGGIRSGQGNTYFKFAPPTIAVEGASGQEDVLCDGTPLQQMGDSGWTFALPPRLEAGKRITVEVISGGTVVRRQALFLSEQLEWNVAVPLFTSDRFGVVHESDGLVAGEVGGAVGAPVLAGFPIRPDARPTRRGFVVGRRPGEIRSLPLEHPIDEWEPVWLVEIVRRGMAEYCGMDLSNSRPLRDVVGARDEQVLWKDLLWHRRKRITPPDHPALRTLWREYVEAARHV
jgi:hypothetical protein